MRRLFRVLAPLCVVEMASAGPGAARVDLDLILEPLRRDVAIAMERALAAQ